MKNKKTWLGILAMVLVFTMAFVGCDNDNGGGGSGGAKTLVITEITGKTGEVEITLYSTEARGLPAASANGSISNNSVTVALLQGTSANPWTGSGEFYIQLDFTGWDKYEHTGSGSTPLKFNFQNTTTSISFSQFNPQAGNTDDNFNAVTDITGVPTTGTVGTAVVLSGTVVPNTATNSNITWSVKTAGSTGANITNDNQLNATSAGSVVVTATIINGTASGTNYNKDFTVTFSGGAVGIFDGTTWKAIAGQGWDLTLEFTTGSNYSLTGERTSSGTYSISGGKDITYNQTSPSSATYRGYIDSATVITANFTGFNTAFSKQ